MASEPPLPQKPLFHAEFFFAFSRKIQTEGTTGQWKAANAGEEKCGFTTSMMTFNIFALAIF